VSSSPRARTTSAHRAARPASCPPGRRLSCQQPHQVVEEPQTTSDKAQNQTVNLRWERLLCEQANPRRQECRTPENPARCLCGSGDRLTELCEIIDENARIVDSQLAHPARWRGQTRRELLGYCVGSEAMRYGDTFDWVVQTREPITEHRAIELHLRAVGWRAYRTCHLWVDHGYRHPEPDEIPKLLRLTFARLNDSDRQRPVAALALGLHLDFLTAHPFTDGNGRTARLAATGVLANHGYRSTLITAVEQFFHAAPLQYLQVLDDYRFARACRTRTIEQLLIAMAASSAGAAWAKVNGLSLAGMGATESGASAAGGLLISRSAAARRCLLAQLQRIELEERGADVLGQGS
jgi:hypothetical protein